MSKAGISVASKANMAKTGISVTPTISGSGAPKSLGSTTISPMTTKPSNIKSKMNLPGNLDVTITTVAKPGLPQPSAKLSVGSQPPKVASSNSNTPIITASCISQTSSLVENKPASVTISKAKTKTSMVVNKQPATNIKPAKELSKAKQTDKETKALIPQLRDLSTSISLAIATPTVSSNPMDLSKPSPNIKSSYQPATTASIANMYQHDPASLLHSHMATSLTVSKQNKNYQPKGTSPLPGSKGTSPSPVNYKTIAQESRPAKNITPVAKVTKSNNKNTPKTTPGGVVNVRNSPITTPKAGGVSITPKAGKSTTPKLVTPVNRSKPNTPNTSAATAPLSVLSANLVTPPISSIISVSLPSQPLPPSSLTSISNHKPPSSVTMQTNSINNQLSSFQETFAQNLNFSEESPKEPLSGSELSQFNGRQSATAALKTSVKPKQTSGSAKSAKSVNTPIVSQPSASATAETGSLLASQTVGTQIKPSSTSKPIKPEQSKKVTSSSERANAALSLTPDITHSLLGFAQNMVSNLEQQELSSPFPPLPATASPASPQQWTAHGPGATAAPELANNHKSAAVAASQQPLDYINIQKQPQQLQNHAQQMQKQQQLQNHPQQLQNYSQQFQKQQPMSKKANGYDIT